MCNISIRIIIFWSILIFLSGCQTKGLELPFSGTSVSDERKNAISADLIDTAVVYENRNPHNSFLVTIRYPARITKSAIDSWITVRKSIFQKYNLPPASDTEHERALANQIVKTTYYALELYQHLSSLLPAGAISLQPTEVDTELDGKLLQRVPASPVPTVLVLDFLAYVHTDALGNHGVRTFGNRFAPITLIATSPQAWVTTSGVVAMRYPDMPSVNIDPMKGAYGHGGTRYIEHDANQYLGGPKERCVPPGEISINSLPLQPSKFLSLPILNLEMNSGQIRQNARLIDGRIAQSPALKYHEMIGSIVVQALNMLDHYLAVRDAWKNHIAIYDPLLAKRWPRWPLSQLDEKRMSFIKQAIGVERTFLGTNDQKFADSAYSGSFGASVRRITAAETELVEKAREIKEQRDAQIAFTMFASIASGIMNENPNFLQVARNVVSQAAVITDKSRQSIDSLEKRFDSHFRSVSAEVQEYLIKTSKGEIVIRGQNLEDLREVLRKAYENTFTRSKSADPRFIAGCTAKLNDHADKAIWSGDCKNGRASGFGLLRHYQNGQYIGENDGHYDDGVLNGTYWYYESSGYDTPATKDQVYPVVGLPPRYRECKTFQYLFGGIGAAVSGVDGGAFEYFQNGKVHNVLSVNNKPVGPPSQDDMALLRKRQTEWRKVTRALIGK